MKSSLIGLAALPLLATVALAAQPVALNDKQMDAVVAGFDFVEYDVTNTGQVYIGVNQPAGSISGSYLNVVNTWFNNSSAPAAMQTIAIFGP